MTPSKVLDLHSSEDFLFEGDMISPMSKVVSVPDLSALAEKNRGNETSYSVNSYWVPKMPGRFVSESKLEF